jgi:hypothetical protein
LFEAAIFHYCASRAAWTGLPACVPARSPARAPVSARFKFATLGSCGVGKESALPRASQPARLLARRSLQACALVTKDLSCYYYILLHYYYLINTTLLQNYFAITEELLQVVTFPLLQISS